MASDTIKVPRELPESLLGRLHEIALYHGGKVPLHGRLFAQWMHHAYPRKCPYPHVTGTTSPQRAEDWVAQTGQEATASEEEMRMHAAGARKRSGSDGQEADRQGDGDEDAEVSMWTMEEELLVSRPLAQSTPPRSSCFRGVFFVAAVISAAWGLYQTVCSATSSRPDLLLPKYQQKIKV